MQAALRSTKQVAAGLACKLVHTHCVELLSLLSTPAAGCLPLHVGHAVDHIIIPIFPTDEVFWLPYLHSATGIVKDNAAMLINLYLKGTRACRLCTRRPSRLLPVA